MVTVRQAEILILRHSASVGIEFKLEIYDHRRCDVSRFVTALPEFLSTEDGQWHLSIDGEAIAATVRQNNENVLVTQYVSCRETDALLAVLIRQLLSLNDHVVVSQTG